MNKLIFISIIGIFVATCYGDEPFKPAPGSIDFIVYFLSRYRGICVGSLLAPTVVITAAVCVAHPTSNIADTRSINVVAGSSYRHWRSGVRVQVSKVLLPKIMNSTHRTYIIQRSPAILLLHRQVPDAIADVPLRPINIDYMGEQKVALHEDCMTAGWHYFFRGDKIYPAVKFYLPRNLRVQFVKTAKRSLWCGVIELKYQKALSNMGLAYSYDNTANVCVRDGMYGAPLICHGKLVALMLAPDAQWTNCTGYSNIMHLVSASQLRSFMSCVSPLFTPTPAVHWDDMKRKIQTGAYEGDYDYTPEFYDKVIPGSSLED